jgi:hypothetical protein
MKALLLIGLLLFASAVALHAKELDDGTAPTSPYDWLLRDRLTWDAKSKELIGQVAIS